MNDLFNTAKYILDSDTFITAKNGCYRFDTFKGFWDCLVEANKRGEVYSIEAVRHELSNEKDQLSRWLKFHGQQFFLGPDQPVKQSAAEVAKWVNNHPRYTPAAKQEFFRKADFMLVAHGLAHSLIVVTFETDDQDSIANIKIPTVCRQFGVKWMNLYQMLAALNLKFVLDGKEPKSGGNRTRKAKK